MSDPDPVSDAKIWIRHAREDFHGGRRLLEEGTGVPRQIRLVCSAGSRESTPGPAHRRAAFIPYTHDLERLAALLSEEGHPQYKELDVEQLSTYAVDTRLSWNAGSRR
jgi:HEPN domain-containing protein